MTIKELRVAKHLTQQEVADRLGISLRSYITYENDVKKIGTVKYRYIVNELEKWNPIDEEHGVLYMKDIVDVCKNVFEQYQVSYCYLFGSYAKGNATQTSDVDLLISSDVTGLEFYELTERLRENLHKKIDLLDVNQLLHNEELLNEILKDGKKIYG
mgnify:CR=1 FL=1